MAFGNRRVQWDFGADLPAATAAIDYLFTDIFTLGGRNGLEGLPALLAPDYANDVISKITELRG